MKIVYICLCGLYIPGWSYQENILSKYQVQEGHSVTIITSKWIYDKNGHFVLYDGDSEENDHGAKIVRLTIKGNKDFNRKLKRFTGLYEKICEEKPDLIFLHSPQLLDADVICRYMKENQKVRLIVDNHCDCKNSAKNWLSKNILHRFIWKRRTQMLDKYADTFYGVTPARKEFLEKMYSIPKDRIRLLPFGADDECVKRAMNHGSRNAIRTKYGIGEDIFLLLSGGKIDSNKKETIDLMAAVTHMEGLNVKLLLFGSVAPELKERFDKLLESEKIIYVGWLSSNIIYDYFDACDLVLFPGLHSVLWEQAVGAGKACVFRKIDGFTHIDLGGNCRFFEGLSAEIIRKQLTEIIKNDEISSMTKVAKVKGVSYFSYKRIAQECLGL